MESTPTSFFGLSLSLRGVDVVLQTDGVQRTEAIAFGDLAKRSRFFQKEISCFLENMFFLSKKYKSVWERFGKKVLSCEI